MRVTDAQVHIWADTRSSRPGEALFPLERLEKDMSEAKVDRVVLVPTTHGFKNDAAGANEYSFAVAHAQPHRFAVMALIDPERPDGPATLAGMMKRPGMKGLRLHLARQRYDAMDWIWPEAVRLGMPVAIFAGRGSFERLLPILERYPDLSVLLDHVAVPAEGPDPFAEFEKVLGLARHKNVVVKVSALTRYSKEAYPFRDLHKYIRRLYETFGPQRLAWGSDYSTHANRATYREVVDLLRVECDFLSVLDREWILDKTVSRVLRWED